MRYISSTEFDLMTNDELDAVYGTEYKHRVRLEDERINEYIKNYYNGKEGDKRGDRFSSGSDHCGNTDHKRSNNL